MRRLPRRDLSISKSQARRGAIIVFAMLALLIVSMLGASLMRSVLATRQQLGREALHMQAVWLAESGAARAVARLKSATDYTGEAWTVPAGQLSGERTALVRIAVAPEPDQTDRVVVTATAEYPPGSPTAIRITKRVTVVTRPTP